MTGEGEKGRRGEEAKRRRGIRQLINSRICKFDDGEKGRRGEEAKRRRGDVANQVIKILC